MGGFGHRELSDGARFAGRAGSVSGGARIAALLATAVLHMLAFASLVVLTNVPQSSDHERSRHLTVISWTPPPTHAEPPSHTMVRHAGPASAQPPSLRLVNPIEARSEALPSALTSVPVKRAEVAAEPLRSPPVASQVEAEDALLRDYQAIIWRHIAAHKPRGVQIKGTVTVTFQLDRDGAVLALTVVRSSGNFNLDRIALRAIRQSGAFPQPPAELASSQLYFIIPIDFR